MEKKTHRFTWQQKTSADFRRSLYRLYCHMVPM